MELGMKWLRTLWAVSLVLGAAPCRGQAQLVTGVRPLAFGVVLPGMPRSVLRTDPVNSGQYNIGTGGQQGQNVQIAFTLPAVLAGPAGATMPITFGATSGGYSATGSIASQVGFDPRLPFVTQAGQGATSAVFLGGTVNPGASQRAGSYTATVTLILVFLP
jgi:hypothetical protein